MNNERGLNILGIEAAELWTVRDQNRGKYEQDGKKLSSRCRLAYLDQRILNLELVSDEPRRKRIIACTHLR